MKPQCEKILVHLDKHGSITSAEAMSFYGISRLASRVDDLKKYGYTIGKVTERGVNRFGEPVSYARYFLGGANDTV